MRKSKALKVGRVQREEKREKKNVFCELEKSLLVCLLFFHYSFSFALQR
jgi:hypothetical protein